MSRTAKRLILNFGGAAAFSPLTISGLFGWWDTTDTSTLKQDSAGTTAVTATNDPVGYWGDKSGNARHFIQAGAGTLKPTYQGAGGGMSFDGGDYLELRGLSTTFTAQTVVIVFNMTSLGSARRVFSQKVGARDDYSDFVPVMQTGASQPAVGGYIGGYRAAVTLTAGAKKLMTSVHSGSALTNYGNGVAGTPYTHTLNLAFAAMSLGVGLEVASAGGYYTGRIYEALVFNRAITDTERTNLEAYLNAKWTIY